MPQLDSIKHELFSRSVVEHKGNLSQAYRDVYDPQANGSAGASGSRLLENVNVKARVIYLMDKQGLTLERLGQELDTCVSDEDKRLKLQATQFAYKLHGATDDTLHIGDTHQHIHISTNELQSMPSGDKLAKLRELLRWVVQTNKVSPVGLVQSSIGQSSWYHW